MTEHLGYEKHAVAGRGSGNSRNGKSDKPPTWSTISSPPRLATASTAVQDWGKLFHNAAAASAIADRLVHRGLLIKIVGKSKRSDQEVE